MHSLTKHPFTTEHLDELDAVTRDTISPEVRDFLKSALNAIRNGDNIFAVNKDEDLSPQKAADFLRMSRTHLYKLLDKEIIPSHKVGKHRRIALKDVLKFEEQRNRDRKELAERFAKQRQTKIDANNALADML